MHIKILWLKCLQLSVISFYVPCTVPASGLNCTLAFTVCYAVMSYRSALVHFVFFLGQVVLPSLALLTAVTYCKMQYQKFVPETTQRFLNVTKNYYFYNFIWIHISPSQVRQMNICIINLIMLNTWQLFWNTTYSNGIVLL